MHAVFAPVSLFVYDSVVSNLYVKSPAPLYIICAGHSSSNIILYQPVGPQCLVSPKAPAAVNTILLVDSMGKSFPQNDNLIKVVTVVGSNYYASGLIVSQLLDISHFHQVFMLLGSNLLKPWNTTTSLKAAVQEFFEAVYTVNLWQESLLVPSYLGLGQSKTHLIG